MDKFNEDEIQKKIEEKRKRFIENAHRALGFYDQNILTNSEEHKKKRSELMEKEFNKVFDDEGQPLRRYDEEPSKPLILAASKNPENITSLPEEEKANKEIMDTQASKLERQGSLNQVEEDSLTVATKEQEIKNRSPVMSSEHSTSVNTMPVQSSSKSPLISRKETEVEEEK